MLYDLVWMVVGRAAGRMRAFCSGWELKCLNEMRDG
jgi:hypothetical protein